MARRPRTDLETADVPDGTSALAVQVALRRGARQRGPPQSLLFCGADHGDEPGEEEARRIVKAATTAGSFVIVDEFSTKALAYTSREWQNKRIRMEPKHACYFTSKEPFLNAVVSAYFALSDGELPDNVALKKAVIEAGFLPPSPLQTVRRLAPSTTARSPRHGARPRPTPSTTARNRRFGFDSAQQPQRPAQLKRLLDFATGADGLSPILGEVYKAAASLASPSDDLRGMYARVIQDVIREIDHQAKPTPSYTSSCGLATFRGSLPIVSQIFAAFRASLDVRTFLFMRHALEQGTAVVGLHAGRSHLKNVLTLFQHYAGLRCDVSAHPHQGRGTCAISLRGK